MSDATNEQSFDMTLEQFCAELSTMDKRVELIGGFYSAEKAAGHIKASHADFSARFEAFQNQPA